ncbi:tripartite tricarboxylate transporter TctB family protein [Billgrantia aerodenitrificans]|uniref:Tripartite tricarboxylate transporter TctB family protein n=1 Tax=Billgrantia aerodenitrificans TaxID=2733483 RepID=A0ABS9ARI1_9GAMM|nr:tripartite tricarboxylate transporter TctB family protein [Halomonas aerodenitrificans]MCE8024360.1 tripartite tricarboxylate transporter TctB family protein [Halomonas aerodenitrificans]
MNRTNVLSGIVCFAIGAFVFWLSADVPSFTATDELGGRFFPRLISVLFMLASLGLVITGWMNIEIQGGQVGGGKGKSVPRDEDERVPDDEPSDALTIGGMRPGTLRLFGFIAVMAVYTMILPLIGYIPASLVVFAALIMIAGEYRPLRVLLGTIGITAVLYLLFAAIFGMNVPTASLF